ncbi:PAS domain-containing protein [Sphingomonas sp. HF-S4]|uniref:histidine kinase n=1 Tax=Sphingomonas agrestis TaxID=3080540 RepID=A0ABU3Y348_9SPHN|nr:PAS domain-containing protein [Sphingomonas sp. HF-S4]MDV3455795.1 PAS domain-containing protein [Sphingomonas sp. HF-S4]
MICIENGLDAPGEPVSAISEEVATSAFLVGGGEMGALMREHDWLASTLGEPQGWPQPLKTLVALMLAAGQPMFVAWGPDRTLLYNDAYAVLMADRHPAGFARPFFTVWPDIEMEIAPLFERVFKGAPVHMADIELSPERPGRPREAHFAFSYTPVRDMTDAVAGLFCVCSETTDQVFAERRLAEDRDRQRRLFERAPGFIAILAGPEHRFEFANEAFDRLFDRRDLAGRTVAEAFPIVDGQRFFELLDSVYAGGERFVANAMPVWLASSPANDPADHFLDFIFEPVRDDAGTVTSIFIEGQDVTGRVRAGIRREALLSLDDRLRDELDTADLSFAASELLGQVLGATRVGYGAVNTETGTITVDRTWGEAGFDDLAGVHRFADYGAYIDDLRRGTPVPNADVEGDPRTAKNGDAFRKLGIRAHLDVPVVEHGQMIATMFVHSAMPRDWTDEEVSFVRDFAARTRAAIARRVAEQERADAEASLRESEARQAFLLELSDALRSLYTPAEIASAAAEKLCERFDLNRVFYAEYFGSVMRVERDFTKGVDTIVGEHDLEAFGPELLRAYHECPVVKVNDVATDARFNDQARSGLRARQVGAYLDVVLFENEKWVSLLAFQSATPRKWTAAEEDLFREVGERVKAAIERARVDEQLLDLNETLEQRVEQRTAERNQMWTLSRDVMLRCGLDGRILAVNPAWTETLGWREEELVGQILFELIHPEDLRHTQEGAQSHAEGRSFERFENRYRTKGGDYRWISWSTRADANVIVAVGRDITEDKEREKALRQAEEALRQSQKMEAMGSLTGGVAHDFNNLLTPIIGSLDMLVRKGIGNDRERRLIDGALQSAERAKVLVQRLLAFARRQPLQPIAVDVGRLIDGMAGLIGSTLGPTIDVRVDLAVDLPPAQADPNQLEMALLNLAVNARDAMPEGGQLTIEARRESIRGVHNSGVKLGHYVKLRVADSGVGMDEATLARAVEPFFSTKGIGKGTGLGLSMVHGLAAQLGGGLTIESQPDRGTSIELWLPISGTVVGDDDEAAPAPAAGVGRGTALLVDDEELVRMSTADMLIDLGFEVIEASSAEEALLIVRSGADPDILVTDHLMPGMNGADLAREARVLKPSLRVLVVSGYADMEGIAPELPRLTKPFRSSELATSLATIIPLDGA